MLTTANLGSSRPVYINTEHLATEVTSAAAEPSGRLDACLLGNDRAAKRQKVFLYIGAPFACSAATAAMQCHAASCGLRMVPCSHIAHPTVLAKHASVLGATLSSVPRTSAGIISARNNYKRRQAVRDAWGDASQVRLTACLGARMTHSPRAPVSALRTASTPTA